MSPEALLAQLLAHAYAERDKLRKQNEALQADNAELREALERADTLLAEVQRAD